MEEEAPTRDVEYRQGLREAVALGVEFGVTLLIKGTESKLHFPIALVTQARLAARQRVPLEMVIRRYIAGKAVLGDFMFQESATIGIQDHKLLRNALASQEAAFDQLLKQVTDEYGRERDRSTRQPQRLNHIQRLLAGEMTESSLLNYDFDCHHLAVVAGSPEARPAIQQMAAATGSRVLTVDSDHGEVWTWLGSKEPLDSEAVCRLATSSCSTAAPVGVGESSWSRAGWRLTHQQARLALSIARAAPTGLARYANVAIVASAAQDPVLAASLQHIYLAPLNKGRSSDKVLRETLRAYFSADRNGSSAASALGVSRQTVTNRLVQVEDRLGQPLRMCADSVDAALRLEELGFLCGSLTLSS
jgi:hypothetical protein